MLSEKYMHATPKRDIVKMIQSFVLEIFCLVFLEASWGCHFEILCHFQPTCGP